MQIETHADIIDIWQSKRLFADDVGEELETVRQWHKRSSIPARKWPRVLAAAIVRGYWVITPDAMLRQYMEREAA